MPNEEQQDAALRVIANSLDEWNYLKAVQFELGLGMESKGLATALGIASALEAKGYLEKRPAQYGHCWRITDAGRARLAENQLRDVRPR